MSGENPLLEERQAAARAFLPTVEFVDADADAYLRGALGQEQFESIRRAGCLPALTASLRVNTLRVSPAACLAALEAALEPTGLRPFILPCLPYVILVRGTGPHDVDYEMAVDQRTGAVRELVVDRPCGEAVLRGADIYVPGVLACTAGVEPGDLVAVTIGREPPREAPSLLGCSYPLLTPGPVTDPQPAAPRAM